MLGFINYGFEGLYLTATSWHHTFSWQFGNLVELEPKVGNGGYFPWILLVGITVVSPRSSWNQQSVIFMKWI